MKKYLHILICSFITILPLSAQNVGLHTTTPLAKLHVDLGDNHANGILFTGLDPTGGTFPSLGAGRRFMYYPGKGAFRAGVVEGTHWDNALVGNNSVAFGFNSIARAPLTFALGDETRARGFISSAFGSNTIAKGYSSMVMGMFNDSLVTADQDAPIPGTPLFIIGNGDDNATRNNAMVVYKNGNMILQNPEPFYFTKLPVNYPIPVEGEGTRMMWLPEIGAFRVGSAIDSAWNANKIGPGSFATGANATASGVFSFAAGLDTKASSGLSTVFGYGNQTKGYSSTAIGMFNDPILTAVEDETAAPGSPLFMIGNGDDYDERHNALVVFKNGNLLMKNPQPYYVTGVPAEFEMPVEGAGTRMMWIPEMSAFRAGTVGGNDWDEAQLGIASFAGGQNTVARGFATTAFGNNNSASGDNATALGVGNITNGFGALTVGLYNNPIIGLPQDEIDFITPLFIIGNGNNLADRKNAMVVRKDGHVGIGTNTPITTLHVDVDYNLSDGFIFEGEFTPGALNPNLGAGTRMLFFPGKGSFRAGSVSGTQWNNSNTGDYSVAMGQNTTASGVSAAAFGEGTFATGENSFSYGEGNHAIGENSLSFGYYNAAVAINSTAGGAQSRARGYGSTVSGWYNIAKRICFDCSWCIQ